MPHPPDDEDLGVEVGDSHVVFFREIGYRRVVRKLGQKLGRKPTEDEIAVEMQVTVPELREIVRRAREPVLLEAGLEGQSEREARADDSSTGFVPRVLQAEIIEVMSGLAPGEQEIIRLRFGLNDGKQRSVEDVSELCGVTSDEVRLIEKEALEKIEEIEESKAAVKKLVAHVVAMEKYDDDDDFEDGTSAFRRIPRAALAKIVSQFNSKEREILRMKWGLIDGRHRSAGEVARALGVTSNEVIELEARALRML